MKNSFNRNSMTASLLALLVIPFTASAIPIVTGDLVWSGSDVPDDLTRNAYEDNDDIFLWHESTLTLDEDLKVNWGGDKTVNGKDYVSAGQEICAYLLHHDRVNENHLRKSSGTVTFDGEILGIIYRHNLLINTDDILGQSDTTYWTGSTAQDWRGLDNVDPDNFSVSGNSLTLTANLWVKAKMDELRVITTAKACPVTVPDGGATALLLTTSLVGIGVARRRFSR